MTHPQSEALLHLTSDILVHAEAGRWNQAAVDLQTLASHRGSSPEGSRKLCALAATDAERLVRRALRMPTPPVRVSPVHAETAAARLLFRTFDPRDAA